MFPVFAEYFGDVIADELTLNNTTMYTCDKNGAHYQFDVEGNVLRRIWIEMNNVKAQLSILNGQQILVRKHTPDWHVFQEYTYPGGLSWVFQEVNNSMN